MAVICGESGQQEDEHRNASSHNPPYVDITGSQRHALFCFASVFHVRFHLTVSKGNRLGSFGNVDPHSDKVLYS